MIYGMIWYDMIWYDMIWYDMIWYDMIWYDMMYSTAIGLTPGGSSTVLIYPQTIYTTTQRTQTKQVECRTCPVFALIFYACSLFFQSVSNLQNWQTAVTLFRWFKYKFQLQYFRLPSPHSSQLYMKRTSIFIIYLYVIFLCVIYIIYANSFLWVWFIREISNT